MAKADYEIVKASDDVIYIVDLDVNGVSVTNDARNVVAEIAVEHPGRQIIYRDTLGRWDEIVHLDGEFEAFRPWTGEVPAIDVSNKGADQ